MLSNTDIAELLAQQAERETGILSRAYRRAARSAFLWPEEVSDLVAQNRSLTELRGIGPFIETQIRQWIDKLPQAKIVPAIRQDFLSLAEARRLLAARPAWQRKLRGDLQMHTRWSDGSGTIAEIFLQSCLIHHSSAYASVNPRATSFARQVAPREGVVPQREKENPGELQEQSSPGAACRSTGEFVFR